MMKAQETIQHLALLFHSGAQGEEMFKHFKLDDNNMLWRFTSTPSEEYIKIEQGTTYEEILRVIASHSGGNDKSNPNVKTLSFGRNLAALIGTAASKGGDKHVTNIIDKAAYLFGIDIGSLAGKGITAHPAMGRAISLFESEYVLVSSPGNPPVTLEELATAKYENPFRGKEADRMLKGDPSQKSQFESVVEEMGTKTAEAVSGLQRMDPARVARIVKQAEAVTAAANEYAGLVKDKTSMSPQEPKVLEKITTSVKEYIKLINENLKK
jgi:hypothetical protein